MGGTAVIASTPVADTTAPTRERIIRHQGGADENDCCQCSEGTSKHGLSSCHACGSGHARPATIHTPGQPLTMSGSRLDLDQWPGRFGGHAGDARQSKDTLFNNEIGAPGEEQAEPAD
jgi:hypothetical protein